MIDLENFQNEFIKNFKKNTPFDYCVVNNFFSDDLAKLLEKEFLEFNSPDWYEYRNPFEVKKTTNNWNHFKKNTYEVFQYLNSPFFVKFMSSLLGEELIADPGLHGGGLHIHGDGGNLNPHLDYSIHPKNNLQRRLNIIIYVSENLNPEIHGGHLGFWSNKNMQPYELIKEIPPFFNSAVIFDTSQNSWHGLSKVLSLPKNIFRKSLAIYYLQKPKKNISTRHKALYYPRDNQINDESIKELIKKRASDESFSEVYKVEGL